MNTIIKNSVSTTLKSVAYFFKSETSQDALRNILIILIPSILIFMFWDDQVAIPFAVGTLLACLTDLPGNKMDKLTTFAYCTPIFLITALSISLTIHHNSWTIILLLGGFGFVYSFIALLGFRISVVGNLGLIVASFTIGLRPIDPILFSTSLTLGAISFFIICLIQVYLFPNRSFRHALEGGVKAMSKLIRLKIDCYNQDVSINKTYQELNRMHIHVSDQLDSIRSILLRDKRMLTQKDNPSKIWLTKLYQLIDLYEFLMAIDHDYEKIRDILKEGKTLKLIRQSLAILSVEIEGLTTSKQDMHCKMRKKSELHEILKQLDQEQKLGSSSRQELISSICYQLRKIDGILQNFHIQQASNSINGVESKNFKNFVAPKNNIKVIIKNLHLKSPFFVYAIRISILLIFASLLGYLLPGYQYASWIILTIILVARPSYTITQKRNFQRIVGSIIGILLSLALLIVIQDSRILISIAALGLYLFLLFNKPNYLVCVIFITITILLAQYAYEGDLQDILGSRFLFTLLGSVLAILGTLAIPINHSNSIEQTTGSLIQHFKSYLEKIQESSKSPDRNNYDLRLSRKFTQASLAQCYASLEQFEKNPGKGKYYKSNIRQFQTLAYQINALLVGLTVNITKLGMNHPSEFLEDRIFHIQNLIQESEIIINQFSFEKVQTKLF